MYIKRRRRDAIKTELPLMSSSNVQVISINAVPLVQCAIKNHFNQFDKQKYNSKRIGGNRKLSF